MMAESHAGVPVLRPFLASRSHQTSNPVLKGLPSTQETSQGSMWCVGNSLEHCSPNPPAFSLALGWSLQQLMARVMPALWCPDTESGHQPSTNILHPAAPPSMSQLLCPKPAWAPSSLLSPTASPQHTAPVPWLAPQPLVLLCCCLLPLHPPKGSSVPPGAPGPVEQPSAVPWQGWHWWHHQCSTSLPTTCPQEPPEPALLPKPGPVPQH